MDALVVDGFDFKPADALVLFEEEGSIADDILDEDGIVEGLHGDVALVGTLQWRVDGGGGRLLGNGDELFDPDELPEAVLSLGANSQRDETALVVGGRCLQRVVDRSGLPGAGFVGHDVVRFTECLGGVGPATLLGAADRDFRFGDSLGRKRLGTAASWGQDGAAAVLGYSVV